MEPLCYLDSDLRGQSRLDHRVRTRELHDHFATFDFGYCAPENFSAHLGKEARLQAGPVLDDQSWAGETSATACMILRSDAI